MDNRCLLQCVVPNTILPAAVAALAAEPETIGEFELALTRYIRVPVGSQIISALPWSTRTDSQVDFAVLDLRNKIVVTSTISISQSGHVNYHEFLTPTNLRLSYLVSDDWLFKESTIEYESLTKHAATTLRRFSRTDARAILYGTPVLQFITAECKRVLALQTLGTRVEVIKSNWLSRPREDLNGKSPRQVLLEKRHFIDNDLNSRERQWKIQGLVPACLPTYSNAYRSAGFGSIECLVYCEMLEYLILAALENHSVRQTRANFDPVERLVDLQTKWLTTPDKLHGGRIPAQIVSWERRRLPLVCAANARITD